MTSALVCYFFSYCLFFHRCFSLLRLYTKFLGIELKQGSSGMRTFLNVYKCFVNISECLQKYLSSMHSAHLEGLSCPWTCTSQICTQNNKLYWSWWLKCHKTRTNKKCFSYPPSMVVKDKLLNHISCSLISFRWLQAFHKSALSWLIQ